MNRPPRQGLLFGDIEQSASVRPARVADALVSLARRLPPTLRLGTSSWSFAGWNGIVYAPGSRPELLARCGLPAYAQHPLLRTVAIDRTFYGPLQADDFARYASDVPDDFRFLVKAWGECTKPRAQPAGSSAARPNPHYLDKDFTIDHVIAPAAEGLADLLGTLLFQFPPQHHDVTREPAAFADRLGAFLGELPRGATYAVELRDAALMTKQYFEALAAAGAHHCYSIHPRMPAIERQREMAPGTGPVIVRWMLQPPLGYQEARKRFEPFANLAAEDPRRRTQLATLCADATLRGAEVTVAVNNKAEGSAPLSVFELARSIVTELGNSS